MSFKQMVCKHEYIYSDRVLFAVNPPVVRGVCKKCGKTTTISYEEYKRMKIATKERANAER